MEHSYYFFCNTSCKELTMYLTSELHLLLILVYAASLRSSMKMERYW